jgi:hypothetical protein
LRLRQIEQWWVDRTEPLNYIVGLLLDNKSSCNTVAIYGMGGLGKSVLAEAVRRDERIQAHFKGNAVGITLGQNPQNLSILRDCLSKLGAPRPFPDDVQGLSDALKKILVQKKALLLIDDVWSSQDVKWFLVESKDCRFLVTTREASELPIPEKYYYPLPFMEKADAENLVRNILGLKWKNEMSYSSRKFAEKVGYLPLALELGAKLVKNNNISWKHLLEEFDTCRTRVLKSLKTNEKVNVEDERYCNLNACFFLSLKRLEAQEKKRFTWLGVLKDDASFDLRVVSTLWGITPHEAQLSLSILESRSLIRFSGSSISNESELNDRPRYRIHDLLHAKAEDLVTQSSDVDQLGLGLESMAKAHHLLIEKYRKVTPSWDKLKNDDYIYQYLIWHLEQANQTAAIHELLALSDEYGRNAWFEACDRIGKPDFFIQAINDGWRLAEGECTIDRSRAILLQCRYALMTATLNSLLESLPVEIIAEFLKRDFWSPEQAWSYVEKIHDLGDIQDRKNNKSILTLAPFLSDKSKSQFQIAVKKTQSIQNEGMRANLLCNLSEFPNASHFDFLEVAQLFKDEDNKVLVLCSLTKMQSANFSDLLSAAKLLQDEDDLASVLCSLAKMKSADLSELSTIVKELIKDDSTKALVFLYLTQADSIYFSDALTAAQWSGDAVKVSILCHLTKINGAGFDILLSEAQSLESEEDLALVLCSLAEMRNADLSKLSAMVKVKINDKLTQARVFLRLSQVDGTYFSDALAAVQLSKDGQMSIPSDLLIDSADSINLFAEENLVDEENEENQVSITSILRDLAKIDSADFDSLFSEAQLIEDENDQVSVLCSLAEMSDAKLSKLSEIAKKAIKDNFAQARVLLSIAQVDKTYLSDALRAAQGRISQEFILYSLVKTQIDNDDCDCTNWLAILKAFQFEEEVVAKVLCLLCSARGADFIQLISAVQNIENKYWSIVLCSLSNMANAELDKILEVSPRIENVFSRAKVLISLVKLDKKYFPDALKIIELFSDEYDKIDMLSSLAKVDGSDFNQLISEVKNIQSKYLKTLALTSLSQSDNADFTQILSEVRVIRDEHHLRKALCGLAHSKHVGFSQLFVELQEIQDEHSRAEILISLIEAYGEDSLTLSNIVRLISKDDFIKDDFIKARVFATLAKFDDECVLKAQKLLQLITNKYRLASILCNIAQIDIKYFSQTLTVAQSIPSEAEQAKVLCNLSVIASASFEQLLNATKLIEGENYKSEVLCRLAEMSNANFDQLLDAVESIKDAKCKSNSLCSLAEMSDADFIQLLESVERTHSFKYKISYRILVLNKLASIDPDALKEAQLIRGERKRLTFIRRIGIENVSSLSSYLLFSSTKEWCELFDCVITDNRFFNAILELVNSIQHKNDQAGDFLLWLTQISNANFAQRLEAAQSINSESLRAEALIGLVQVANVDSMELLKASRSLDESNQFELLATMAENSPSNFLPYIYQAIIHEIPHKPRRAKALSIYLSRLDLAQLPYSDWCSHLKLLASQERGDLIEDLATLYPAIVALSSVEVGQGMLKIMREVSGQWK